MNSIIVSFKKYAKGESMFTRKELMKWRRLIIEDLDHGRRLANINSLMKSFSSELICKNTFRQKLQQLLVQYIDPAMICNKFKNNIKDEHTREHIVNYLDKNRLDLFDTLYIIALNSQFSGNCMG